MTPNYYELLNVTPDADDATLKSGWRKAARQSHPDSGGNPAMFALIQTAYEVLCDPGSRARYDASIGVTSPASSAAADEPEQPGTRDETTTSGARTSGQGRHRDQESPSPGANGRESAKGDSRGMRTWPQFTAWNDKRARLGDSVTVTPEGGILLFVAQAAGNLLPFTALFCTFYAYQVNEDQGVVRDDSGITAMLLMVPLLILAGWKSPAWIISVGGLVLGFATGLLQFDRVGVAENLAWWTTVVGMLALNAVPLLKPRIKKFGLDAEFPYETAAEYNVYGVSGTPGAIDDINTRTAARMGTHALHHLTTIRAVRTFFGASPAGPELRTSHLVVAGHRVAVIDTVLWKPGEYQFTSYGDLVCNGEAFPYGGVNIASAVKAWQEKLGPKVEVKGWVIVGSADGDVEVKESYLQENVRADEAQWVLDSVGNWLLEGDPTIVDRRVLAKIATGLPS